MLLAGRALNGQRCRHSCANSLEATPPVTTWGRGPACQNTVQRRATADRQQPASHEFLSSISATLSHLAPPLPRLSLSRGMFSPRGETTISSPFYGSLTPFWLNHAAPRLTATATTTTTPSGAADIKKVSGHCQSGYGRLWPIMDFLSRLQLPTFTFSFFSFFLPPASLILTPFWLAELNHKTWIF